MPQGEGGSFSDADIFLRTSSVRLCFFAFSDCTIIRTANGAMQATAIAKAQSGTLLLRRRIDDERHDVFLLFEGRAVCSGRLPRGERTYTNAIPGSAPRNFGLDNM